MRKKSRKSKQGLISIALVILAAICTYFFLGDQKPQWLGGSADSFQEGASAPAPAEDGELQIQYLDVGQADATLIFLPNSQVMLIDAGGNATADGLVAYLKERNIQKIDYLVGTHPHEDHIGGLDKVINAFEIGGVYMPKIADSQVPTTKTYEDVLTAIEKKGLKVIQGQGGRSIFQGGELKGEMLAPNSDSYSDLNSYSIGVMLTYGEKKFLFMGDAEADSEEEILERFSVKADVLKCGHHGSSTSTSKAFLEAVDPQYAVISCGRDNDYGHPHQEVLTALEESGVTVYRTDLQHTVTAVCDGKTIEFSVSELEIAP